MTSDHPWIAQLQKGDVVRTRSGRLRIVRDVSHHHNRYYGTRTIVTFLICHPSWTGRCYTVMTGNDLVQMGYRPTKAKATLRTAFDWAVEQEISECFHPNDIKLHARDVRGIP